MDQQWTTYSEPPAASRQARYAPHNMTTPQQHQRDPNLPPQIKQDPYASPAAPSRTNSMALASPGGPHTRGPEYNDGDGDVPMEDADPYKPKYGTTRPNHQHRHSQQFLQQVQQEESTAARRYSPMNLSPTSPYSGSTQQGGQNYTSFSPQTQGSNRQSPTRNNPYISPPNSYYSPPSRLSSIFGPVIKRPHADSHACSFSAARAPTTAHPVQHEPRELLPAISDCATQRRVQQRGAVTAHHEPKSSAAAPDRAGTRPEVRQVHEHCRAECANQPTAAIPPRSS